MSREVHKTLFFHHALADNISMSPPNTQKKNKAGHCSSHVSEDLEKIQTKKKRIQETIRIPRKQQTHSELPILCSRLKYRSLSYKLHNKVMSFLTRDENSHLTTTMTRAKTRKQKRFLNDTLGNLHRKFLLEKTDCSISFSLFCLLQIEKHAFAKSMRICLFL